MSELEVSRRRFIGASAAAGGLATASRMARSAESPSALLGSPPRRTPQMMDVTLEVNGRRHALPIEPRTTLLDALREELHLTGTKKGCDQGSCGACTVHIDISSFAGAARARERTAARGPTVSPGSANFAAYERAALRTNVGLTEQTIPARSGIARRSAWERVHADG